MIAAHTNNNYLHNTLTLRKILVHLHLKKYIIMKKTTVDILVLLFSTKLTEATLENFKL